MKLYSITKPILINPLITFRFLFGLLMVVGAIRFMLSDWIQKLYVEPTFFFKFYGFEWVSVPSETGCYILYSLIAISALGIAIGAFYRISAIVFF
ncbi:MAG: HTTM domain-containing protein [Saprospiraceae bacterium]|nr:HTTM domain-containing protein [Saprospiraceae bacterium]